MRILYLKDKYINDFSELRQLFEGNVDNNLRQEILSNFQDGFLTQWLEEGREDEKMIAKRIKAIGSSMPDSEQMNALKSIFLGEEVVFTEGIPSLNFSDHCSLVSIELKVKGESKWTDITKWKSLKNKENLTKSKLSFRFGIKIVKPVNEEIILSLQSDGEKKEKLSLNAEKNRILNVEFRLFNKPKCQKILLLCRNEELWNIDCGDLVFHVSGVTFEMVCVEGGTFTMGATSEQGEDAYDNEKPTHQVTLSSYYIGKTEVTQALWKAVMGNNPLNFKGDNLPVECVTWDDCQTFIRKLNQMTGGNFRLPTEAEWEYAARGGNKSKGYKYSGSDKIGNVAWYFNNSNLITHPVATKDPNELGIYDMSGNVWEWCSDWYGDYSSSSQTNPEGPSKGSNRVLRGGSWYNFALYCRVSNRYYSTPDYRDNYFGLRLVSGQ